MNDQTKRAEIFTALNALAAVVPQMRAAQLMAAIGELCSDLHGRGLWEAEDAEFLDAVCQFRRGIEEASIAGGPIDAAAANSV